jgi:hypothetical protein
VLCTRSAAWGLPIGNILELIDQKNVGVYAADGIAAEIGRADVDLGLVFEPKVHDGRPSPGPAQKMPPDQRAVLDRRDQPGFAEHMGLLLARADEEDMDAGMVNRQVENGVYQESRLLDLPARSNHQLVRARCVRRAQIGPTGEGDRFIFQPDELFAEVEFSHWSTLTGIHLRANSHLHIRVLA